MARRPYEVLRLPALRLQQHPSYPVFLFSVRAHEFSSIADVSRVARDEVGGLHGYQRPEVRRHISDILTYLDSSSSVLFPNSIILALAKRLPFSALGLDEDVHSGSQVGVLEIRIPPPSRPRPELSS